MAKFLPDATEVNARILYWGIDGAGKRTTLDNVAAKLRPDHRGELTVELIDDRADLRAALLRDLAGTFRSLASDLAPPRAALFADEKDWPSEGRYDTSDFKKNFYGSDADAARGVGDPPEDF
jgi:hypothetical protein